MFFFKVTGKKYFVQLGNGKYYLQRVFKEQLSDGTYLRGLDFFLKHRMELTDKNKFLLSGVKPEMEVMYIGKGMTAGQVEIGGRLFPADKWVAVPLDFNSRDKKGQCLFNVLGFKFRSPCMTNSSLAETQDGDSIFILRRYGGMGDILMQSMLFPEIRKQFPNSKITYSIPKEFHPIFENCTDIDEIVENLGNDTTLQRLAVTGGYDFISDISQACIAGESLDFKAKGFMSRSRQQIWAESMGLQGGFHQSCIRITDEEKERAKALINLNGRNNHVVCIAPNSNERGRCYPADLTQRLIDLLSEQYKVVYLDSRPAAFRNAIYPQGIDMRTLGAVISLADLVISVDTAQLHWAGVLGVPAIGLFGVTDFRPRMAHYKGLGIQGKCQKKKLPCWYTGNADCKGKDGIASCMRIDPPEIVKMVDMILGQSISPIRPIGHIQKIGLVIPVFNRPEYLRQTLESLKKSRLPENLTIVLINDDSKDKETDRLFSEFNIPGIEIVKLKNEKNLKIWGTLRKGFDYLHERKFDVMLNLDSDMVVNPDWFERMQGLYSRNPENIISGYNCKFHGGIAKFDDYRLKDSVGGANLMFSRDLYLPFIRPHFDVGNDWDWKMSAAYVKFKKFVVTVPSAMEHIGDKSTLSHGAVSKAEDFQLMEA